MKRRNFLVINTSYFGDTLLTSPLVSNIKAQYKDAYIIFIANKPFVQAAKELAGVDEVLAYDKKGEHRGIKGAWRFYQEYKEKFSKLPGGIEASFVIYGNERGILLSKLWGAKAIYSDNKKLINVLVNNPRSINYGKEHNVANRHSKLLELHSKKPVEILPMQFNPSFNAKLAVEELLNKSMRNRNRDLVALCTVSKKEIKDMPIKDCKELIQNLTLQGKEVVMLGAGSGVEAYVKRLTASQDVNFINLVNKTSIDELGAVLQECKALISVDTGTMHLGLATGTPTVCLFYIDDKAHLASWAPDEKLYKTKVLVAPISVNNIEAALSDLTI